jgi:DeoR/GlpR family transcriptional regulator of sugar metabolism
MLTRHRKQLILDTLRRDGQVVAKALATQLAVSEDTVRRDLRELSREGVLQRVHGGALPASTALADFGARETVSTAEKLAIGRAAAALIRPGQVVFIDGGTTAVQLARSLDLNLEATVLTHSPSVAVALVHSAVEVILIGGRLFKHSLVSVGASAMEAIARVRADSYFMGVTGIHPAAGLSTGDAEEAAIKRAMMAASAETVVLASSEKVGAASPYVIAEAAQATIVLAGKGSPAEVLGSLEALGLDVRRV